MQKFSDTWHHKNLRQTTIAFWWCQSRPNSLVEIQFLVLCGSRSPIAGLVVHLALRITTHPFIVAGKSQCAHIFDREAASFTFTWQRKAPIYYGGIDTFLWEPHSQPPSCDYAEVFYQDDRASRQPRRVLITVSSTPDWMKETSLLRGLKISLSEENDGEMENQSEVWKFLQSMKMQKLPHNTELYNLVPLFLVFEQIIIDTSFFLQHASDEIRKIVSGTSKPFPYCNAPSMYRDTLVDSSWLRSPIKTCHHYADLVIL